MTELLAAALLDLHWHSTEENPVQSVDAFEQQALRSDDIDLAAVPPRYRSSYFQHIWGGGILPAIMPISGPRCWPTMATSGLSNTAD